ncbi:DUF6302 family protein [Streptomyces sp. NPDC006662]|uniref:DUF6302 family protein n=1 Tax=Streptomyces sp. NPDC006662 TaxID=3156902 RepID=UPI00340877EB
MTPLDIRSPYPAPTLGPACEAVDYEWYRDRLADPELADLGIALSVFRLPLLVVPVGGRRQGGSYAARELAVALAVQEALDGQPGFPSLRIRWSPYSDTCHTVDWGAVPPPCCDTARGHFYGYSSKAVHEFLHPRQESTR